MSKLREKIERVLEEKISPSLSLHGGGVEIVDLDEEKGILQLKFMGTCVGCPMANVTFEGMVEQELLKEIKELKQVLNV